MVFAGRSELHGVSDAHICVGLCWQLMSWTCWKGDRRGRRSPSSGPRGNRRAGEDWCVCSKWRNNWEGYQNPSRFRRFQDYQYTAFEKSWCFVLADENKHLLLSCSGRASRIDQRGESSVLRKETRNDQERSVAGVQRSMGLGCLNWNMKMIEHVFGSLNTMLDVRVVRSICSCYWLLKDV